MTSVEDGAGVLDVDRVWVTAAMPRELAVESLQAAELHGTSRSAIIRTALRQYINDLEKNGGRA